MKVTVVTNHIKNNAVELSDTAIKILLRNNAEVFVPDDSANTFCNGVNCLPYKEAIEKADVVVAIGGDGTLIHTAKRAAMLDKPVLGINAGRVGYLAGLEPSELEKLNLLVKGEFTVENRMLLEVNLKDNKFYALNDAVISKGKISRMIDINASVEQGKISYRADGLIVATPTGSTAYSLSAGGPIIDPVLDCIVLTPICPQSLFARTVLVGDQKQISVSAEAPYDSGVYLTVDGEESCPIGEHDTVLIKKSTHRFVQLIKLNEGTFLNALSDKFNLSR